VLLGCCSSAFCTIANAASGSVSSFFWADQTISWTLSGKSSTSATFGRLSSGNSPPTRATPSAISV